jgi:hypothetical protein
MNLLELRKYAIRRRVEIRFGAPQTAHECLISEKGQVKIPGEGKDIRIEEAFDAAETFVIGGSGGNAQRLSREAMASALDEEAAAGDGSSPSAEEDD